MNIGETLEKGLGEMLARYIRPVGHADVAVSCPPSWVRASGAEFFFGVKRDFLNRLVAERKVAARKADRIVLYRYSDIERAIAGMKDYSRGPDDGED